MEGWQTGRAPPAPPVFQRWALLFEDRVQEHDGNSAVFARGLKGQCECPRPGVWGFGVACAWFSGTFVFRILFPLSDLTLSQ